MTSPVGCGDGVAALIERRWFAAMKAAQAAQSECEVLREVMLLSEEAWRRARCELVRLERLRDALGDELAQAELLRERRPDHGAPRRLNSAA